MLIILSTIIVAWILGYPKTFFVFSFMNLGFLGMLYFLMIYFVKIGGTLPAYQTILFGPNVLITYIKNMPISLNNIAIFENIFRFGAPYCFFVHAVNSNLSAKKLFCKYKILYALCILPALTMLYICHPGFFYSVFSYKYNTQNLIVDISFIIILLYFITSFFLLCSEYTQIALSWHKRRYLNHIIGMFLFSASYLVFAQVDPILIYQDYNRVSVFLNPVLLTSSSHPFVWLITFFICILACMFMMYQNFLYYKFEYDRAKLEMTITSKVTSAELTTSMLLHGLKNQLLSAKILNKKIEARVNEQDIDTKALKEICTKLIEVNDDMSEKLSYLYKTMTDVKTVFVQTSTQDLFEVVKNKTLKKDTNGIVTFSVDDGSVLIDKELLAEAIYNIISNALDAVEKTTHKKVTVRMFFTRNHAVISVCDNGSGIDNAVKRKIFMPFTSSKNSATNWGLGLCYSQRIVKKHMGDIRFDSKPNSGTTFFISLPRYLRSGDNG